ncbi:MAG: HAD family hydrolase [Methylobacter sp.]
MNSVTRLPLSMKKDTQPAITCAFVDIGGVLLTNEWDHDTRRMAAQHFELDPDELERRHYLNFNTLEEGKLTLEDYLSRVVFHQQRPFTRTQFKNFMFAQSQPFPDMIELVALLKIRRGLRIFAVSNASRELTEYRMQKFRLERFIDGFICSCFIHIRKPDLDFFRLALDIAQVQAHQAVYIENTPMFVQVAEELGIRGIVHTDCNSTSAKLAALGLENDQVGIP